MDLLDSKLSDAKIALDNKQIDLAENIYLSLIKEIEGSKSDSQYHSNKIKVLECLANVSHKSGRFADELMYLDQMIDQLGKEISIAVANGKL